MSRSAVPRALASLLAAIVTSLAAGVAMIALMLVLRVVAGVPTTFELVGDRIAPLVPAATFSMLIQTAGGYNQLKMLGVVSTLAGQLAVATVVGTSFLLVARRSRRASPRGAGLSPRLRATLVALTLGVWVVLVVALYPNLSTSYVGRPSVEAMTLSIISLLAEVALFAAIVGVSAGALPGAARRMRTAHPRLRQAEQDPAPMPAPVIADDSAPASAVRRSLLMGGVAAGLAVAANGILGSLLARATFSYDGTSVRGPDVDPITPNDRFYIVTKNIVDPDVDPGLWRLEVGGQVGVPASYALGDLLELDQVEQETTLMCISNGVGGGLLSNARWTGVRLADLLERAQPTREAIEVVAHAADGYTDTIPLDSAMAPTTLLVHRMNGESLPRRHGAPVRLIVPGFVGEKQVKWLTRIELVERDASGFYETQGWGPDFAVPSRSRFHFPRPGSSIRAGDVVELTGDAYGGDRGVRSVEVSTDGGASWQDAEISYPGTRLTWSLWRHAWQPRHAGRHTLVVRMIDGEGRRQIEQPRAIVPQGALGLHRVEVNVGG